MKKYLYLLIAFVIATNAIGQSKQFTQYNPQTPVGQGVLLMQNSDVLGAPVKKFLISQLWSGIPMQVQSNGTIQSATLPSFINFTGAGVTVTGNSTGVTVNIPTSGGGGGGGGIADPGANGIIKRTALNTTAVAVAGTDYEAPISILPIAKGGTGTATPGIVAGTNVTVTGTWPNQTINSTGGGGGGGTALTNWVTSTAYTLGSFTTTNQTLYECLTAHTSGTFATDLGANKWVARLTGSLNSIAITSPATTGTINITFDQNKDYAVFTQTGNITITVAASPKVASTITMRILGTGSFTFTAPSGSNNLNAGVFSNTLTNLITYYMDANGNLDYTISNY